jgi:hypothetical protein
VPLDPRGSELPKGRRLERHRTFCQAASTAQCKLVALSFAADQHAAELAGEDKPFTLAIEVADE